MRGERLEQAEVTARGIAGDRRYAFLDGDPARAGKLLTARQADGLLRYAAAGAGASVKVRSPSGRSFSPADAELAAELAAVAGRPVRVREAPGDNFDESHLLLVNLATVGALADEAGFPLDHRRFRANVYLEDMPPDIELGWVGRRLALGRAEVEVMWPCERCVVITMDPESLERRPELLRRLVDTRGGELGIRCRVVGPGSVRVGDFCAPL
jgi:uncharacterized protein YcbX